MMDRCEVAYNDDDLSDIFTWLGFTVANARSSRRVLSSGPGWALGHELTFYDCRTLKTVGVACLKSKGECRDKAALEVGRMQNEDKACHCRQSGQALKLKQCSLPVSTAKACQKRRMLRAAAQRCPQSGLAYCEGPGHSV